MNEIFPILAGAVIGIALGAVAPRLRLPIAIAASVVIGTLATIVSGEYKIGWEFLLIDIPLVGLSAAAGFAGARALSRAR